MDSKIVGLIFGSIIATIGLILLIRDTFKKDKDRESIARSLDIGILLAGLLMIALT
jgi:hypothetical protein